MDRSRSEREKLAAKRLISVVSRHGAATSRTLEQKISDAGPFNQRIDPHVLIPVRNELVKSGRLLKINAHSRDWFVLPGAPSDWIAKRIKEQFAILKLTLDNKFSRRIGDTLEIATYRALRAAPLHSLGGFRNLTDAPTTQHLKKEEPPSIFGGRELKGNKRFDFLVGTNIWAGIECKNIREWLYPDRPEIRHMLTKAIELDIPPILIGRRIPYVTRRLLQPAGILMWETRNQLYPAEYGNIAAQISDKNSLGYFDIRVTDHPTAQIQDFITRIIPEELPAARERFLRYKDLLSDYAYEEISYNAFAARVRRRGNGQNEDRDEDPEADQGMIWE